MRRVLVALVVVSTLALVAAGCSDSGSDDDAGTTTAAPDAADDEGTGGDGPGDDGTTTTEADETSSTTEAADDGGADGGVDGDLVGTWTADAGDLLAANTANFGGTSTLTCSGPVTMVLSDDGTFTHGGEVTCGVAGGPSATGTVTTTGSWQADGTKVTLSGATSTSDLDGMTGLVGDGSADYVVEGDQLTVTFTIDPVGEVSQVYTRA